MIRSWAYSYVGGILSQSSWIRNLLITFGAFWLSLQLVVPMSLLVGKLTGGLVYGDSILAAIVMGMVASTKRAMCAAFGGAITTLIVPSAKPHRWAWIIALLYAIAARTRFHWHRPPTSWDRVSEVANALWPAIVCVATTTLIARLRRNRGA